MKKLKMILPAIMVAFSLVASLTASIAWFSTTVSFKEDNPLMGETEGAYFAYGDGSEDKPFGINHPRHLYNLAWLQYLGIFNKRILGPDSGPCYFELDPDKNFTTLDMSSFTHLPPIGTETQPFIGVFNGNGKTITGLNVTNKYDDMEKHPTAVSSNSYVVPHIVGMFGVVGTYGGGKTANYSDYGITEAIHDLNLDNVKVTTKVTDSLVGILAGYVNGPIADCGISNSSIDVNGQSTTKYSTYSNISDYSVVGFCEDAYKESVNHSVTTMYTPTTPVSSDIIVQEEGDNQGWGGSIDMKTMYNGLRGHWDYYTDAQAYKYYSNKTINFDKNDNQIGDPVYSGTTITATDKYGSYTYSYYPVTVQDGGQTTSQYTFAYGNGNSFMYLYGKHEKTVPNSTVNVTKNYYQDQQTFYIKSSSGNHYLSHLGTTLQDKTTTDEATSWALDSNNYLFTQTEDETKYYLRNYNGTLTVVTNVAYATSWITDEDSYFFSNTDNTAYFITYYNNNWTLRTATSEATLSGYAITDGSGNYLSIDNSGNIINATSEAAATKWNRDSYYNYIYATVGGQTYYLGRDGSELYASTYSYYATNFTINSNRIYYSGYRTTYYIYYSNGWSTLSPNTARTTYWNEHYEYSTTTKYYVSTPVGVSFKVSVTDTYTEQATITTQETYFPLRQKVTGDTPNGIPADTNTGYVVSGVSTSDDDMETKGDIRVSAYSKKSYLKNGVNTVYTINGSGTQTLTNGGTDQSIASNYGNYAKAKSTMASIISNDADIYGLHFMNATISYGGGNSVHVGKAVINGKTYTNFELPTNCIDFNLKEKGYITFFAGTYYSGNNSFFSLHEIVRDSNQAITEIREIEEVYVCTNESYSDVYSNVYKYKGGGYSVAYTFDNSGNKIRVDNGEPYTDYATTSTAPTAISGAGYSSKFKTSWIGQNALNSNTAYYFEIPMNNGEYCLGSVANANGAYLMYLDIGANAEKMKRSAIIDIIKISEEMQTYPKGVGVIVAGGTSSDVNSYCICIGDTYKGVITLSRGDAQGLHPEQGLVTQEPASSNISLSYANGSITVTKDGSTPYSLVSTAVETLIERATYIEYHPSNNTTTKMVITKTTVGNATPVYASQGYILQAGVWVKKNDLVLYYDAMWGDGKQSGKKVTSLSNYFEKLYLDEGKNQSYTSYRNSALSGTVVLQFDTNLYGATKGNSVSVTLTPTTNENANTHVHGLTGYDITISYVDSNGKVVAISGESVVKELNASFTILNNDGTSTTGDLTFTLNGTSVSKGKTITINITVPTVPNS